MRVATVIVAFIVGLGGVAAASAGLGGQPTAQAKAEERGVFKIEGMTCGGCAVAVKMAAKSVDGVKECKVSYEKGTAEVTYDASKTNADAIAKVITEKSGFKATAPTKAIQ